LLTLNIVGNKKPVEALCASCVHEVTQKGFKGEKLTFCGYGGALRKLKFKVSDCTVYFDKRVAPREKPIGYIDPEQAVKPKVTIIKIAKHGR
jgi:hypothetical protein